MCVILEWHSASGGRRLGILTRDGDRNAGNREESRPVLASDRHDATIVFKFYFVSQNNCSNLAVFLPVGMAAPVDASGTPHT